MTETRDLMQVATWLLLIASGVIFLINWRREVVISVIPVAVGVAGLIAFYTAVIYTDLLGISTGGVVMFLSALVRLYWAVMICAYVAGVVWSRK